AKPFSISGSLPLVRDLQRAGLDLTLTGFGKSSAYHGDNDHLVVKRAPRCLLTRSCPLQKR
ncbi:hypothetical protein PC128_g21671, partial [Phytophthora cactorum]